MLVFQGFFGIIKIFYINIYEHSFFDERKRNSTLSEIIVRYNKIVLEVESDPSLRIEFEAR